MSFKDKWKSFSAEDKSGVAFWTANALLWGGMAAGGVAATAVSFAAGAPTVANTAMLAQLGAGPFLGFLGMTVAAENSYKAAQLNTELNKKGPMSAIKSISNQKKRFRDKWKALSKNEKIKIISCACTAAVLGGAGIFAATAGLPIYLAGSYIAGAAGYAFATSVKYENAQKANELTAVTPNIAEHTAEKSHSRQRTLDLTMKPQTLQTVKNRVYKAQKSPTAAKKAIKSDNIMKLVRVSSRQETK